MNENEICVPSKQHICMHEHDMCAFLCAILCEMI